MKKYVIFVLLLALLLPVASYGRYEPVELDDPERDGYIIPGTRYRQGEVLFIEKNEVELNTNLGREKYRITENTSFQKRGELIGINQIKEGDKVLLTFDTIYASDIANIKVEDEGQNIKGILRGKIELVDDRNKEITIKNPYIYKEGKWQPTSKYTIKLKAAGKDLYNGSQKTTLQGLKIQKGKEAYIAYDENLGRQNIAKLVVKNGLAQTYQGKISNILYTVGNMVVSTTSLDLHEGTIVVKDNRLVDYLNLNKYDDVLALVDNSLGKKNTSIVSLDTNMMEERKDDTKISIYRGRLEDIFEYQIEIGRLNYRLDYQVLEDGKWKSVEDKQRFSISEDTIIYDSELKENIDPLHFISSRYINIYQIKNLTLRNRIANDYYKNKQAYFVVREGEYGKELLALNLVPHRQVYYQNINLNHSVIGEIKEVNLDDNTISLNKVKNYNTLNNTWESTSEETVHLDKSVILLNDIPVPLDRLYALPIGSKVYVVKEKVSSTDESYVLLVEN
ncbi:MAG: hypothetical protein M0Q14_06195 [Tissierellaceae bacterium]|nr:hypothetical protein [Tissierellaceae bacterium]